MAGALQPGDLIAQFVRLPTIPSIGDEQDHRTAAQHATAPALVELADRCAYARAPGPVRHRARDGVKGDLGPPRPQLPGDSRQLRGEEEHLDAMTTPGRGVCE